MNDGSATPSHGNGGSPIPEAVREALGGAADICVTGTVNDASVLSFLDQLQKARQKPGDLVVCCTTSGGEANLARRLVLELEQLRKRHPGRVHFLGKSVVYSVGVTIMSAFPVENRFLTADTMLLVHGRQLTLTVELDGPIRASRPKVASLLHEIDTGLKLEEADFRRLVEGSSLSLEEVLKRTLENWYLTAAEAKDLGLVAGVV